MVHSEKPKDISILNSALNAKLSLIGQQFAKWIPHAIFFAYVGMLLLCYPSTIWQYHRGYGGIIVNIIRSLVSRCLTNILKSVDLHFPVPIQIGGYTHCSYSYFLSDEFWWMLIVWKYCLDEFWLFGHSLEVSVTLRGVNIAVHSWGGSIGVPRRGSSWTCEHVTINDDINYSYYIIIY